MHEDAADDEARRRLERLWADHASAVLGYACLRADRADAEEVVAEVFTVAWRRLDDVPRDARPWLLGVARRVLANSRRGAGRRTALTERLAERAVLAQPFALDHADAVGERLRLVEALRRVGEGERELLVLTGVHGLSTAAAGRVLGCTAATAAVRLHRARRRLRAALQALDDAPAPGDPAPDVPAPARTETLKADR